LSYLSQVLKKDYDTIVLPEKLYHKNEFDNFSEEILSKVKDVNIIALSTNTFSQYYANKLKEEILDKYPNKQVILGGQGILEQNKILKIPPQPVLPLIISIDVNETVIDVELLLTNLCPQSCGYCNTPKTQIPIKVDDYLEKIYSKKKIRRITLYDNNPLHKLNFDRTKEFFTKLKQKIRYTPDTVLYCDPALLVDDLDRVYNFLKVFKSRNNNLFFGREHCDEFITNKIMRRTNGELRNQEFLDKEKKAILKLANKLNNTFDTTKGLNFTLVLNYILTPFETKESINKLLDEVNEFMNFKRVIIKSNLLWPFPMTELSEKYNDAFIHVEKLNLELKFFNYDHVNYWKNSKFLDLCNALNCRLFFHYPQHYYSWYNISMIKLARDIGLGQYKKKETVIKIISEIPNGLEELKNRFLEFDKVIDAEDLVGLMKHSNKIFFKLPNEVIEMMCEEFKSVLEFKKL